MLANFRPALVGILLAVCSILLAGTNVAAQTTDVQVTIPEGIIVVQGKASPNAQIKLYENGNTQPAASITADSTGAFSKQLPQANPGIIAIGIQAIDSSGASSILITKQVAVMSQQTSVLTVIVPPTVSLHPQSAPFGSGVMEFSGRTIPGATVKLTIEPSTVLSTAADSQGNYMIPLSIESLTMAGIYTYGVEVEAGSEASGYVIAGTFVISPPVQPPALASDNRFQSFSKYFNRQISAPEITSPSENEYISSDPLIITGHATAGSEVILYDNGVVIGSVLADGDGNWQFYFFPYKETHTIYAQACKNGNCSGNSRSVIIRKPITADRTCKAGLVLSSYRLLAKTGKEASLTGTLQKEIPGVIFISWGDSSDERFDTPTGNDLSAAHAYQEAGTYSGYVIMNDGVACQTATYFTVEVTDQIHPALSSTLLVAFFIGALAAGWLILRTLPTQSSRLK